MTKRKKYYGKALIKGQSIILTSTWYVLVKIIVKMYVRGDDSYRQFYPIHIDLECRLSRRTISIFQAHFLVLEPKISIHIAFFGRFLHDFEELRVASPPNCDDVMSPAGTESSGDPRRLPDPIPIHSTVDTPFFPQTYRFLHITGKISISVESRQRISKDILRQP